MTKSVVELKKNLQLQTLDSVAITVLIFLCLYYNTNQEVLDKTSEVLSGAKSELLFKEIYNFTLRISHRLNNPNP